MCILFIYFGLKMTIDESVSLVDIESIYTKLMWLYTRCVQHCNCFDTKTGSIWMTLHFKFVICIAPHLFVVCLFRFNEIEYIFKCLKPFMESHSSFEWFIDLLIRFYLSFSVHFFYISNILTWSYTWNKHKKYTTNCV